MSKLEECTKINRKIDSPSASNARKADESCSAESKKKRTDRYQKNLLYDDDDEDENKPNAKLEKAIEQDKERNDKERQDWLNKNKPKTQHSESREEKSKRKMESSSDKFKTFVSDDNDDNPLDQSAVTDANNTVDLESDNDDGEPAVKTKMKSPTKLDDGPSSQATGSQSPAPITPSRHVWKTKRPSTSNEESASKRARTSSDDSDDSSTQIDQLLRGVVFVISGIQVTSFTNLPKIVLNFYG